METIYCGLRVRAKADIPHRTSAFSKGEEGMVLTKTDKIVVMFDFPTDGDEIKHEWNDEESFFSDMEAVLDEF